MRRFAVVGCGYWGPNLIRNISKLEGARLVAVADIDEAKLKGIQRLYPGTRAYTSADELFLAGDLDALVIATPVSTHCALAKLALERGLDVLIEKPMTATVAEAEELIALADREKRVLMVDHTFIYTGAVRRIRDMIRKGELGEILYYDSVRVSLGLFQPDISVLFDLAPHDLAIMTHVLDKRPVRVSAVGASPVRWEGWRRESIVYVTVHFEDGTLAHVHVNWLSPVKVRRTLIGGSRKMIIYDHLERDNQLKVFDHGIDVQSDSERYKALVQYRTGDMLAPKVDQTEALETLTRTFLDCIETRAAPPTDGRAGLALARLLEAAQRSIQQDGRAIALEGAGP
jgi:predicted dehydrogenase